MAGKPRPEPCFLDGKAHRFLNGNKLWLSDDRRYYYSWDSLHGEIEWYDSKGRHLGVLDAVTGNHIKPAVPGRKVNVK